MATSSIGSVWRKWDLHFHTPASYDYQNKSLKAKDLVDALTTAGVAAVAVTDHHTMDVAFIREMKRLGGENLTVFPGIELRADQGGPIHYIGVFPEDADLDHLWDTIKGKLELTPAGIKSRGGDDRVYTPIEQFAPLVRKFNGLLTIHAGAKSNSIETIKNHNDFQQQIKYDLTKEFVDIMEVGQIKDVDRHLNMIFPAIRLERPLIICSDNHNASDYTVKTGCWIKADTTMRGLKQIIREPVSRVHIGDRPPSLGRVESNTTKYIKSVAVKKVAGSPLSEKWFDGQTEFNTGLVAIIGNKGSGKSALADILGLLGESRQSDSFSFLSEEKFREPKTNKAAQFGATLTWLAGATKSKLLADDVDPSEVETIKYIPQNHLELICNEIRAGAGGRFDQELKGVIFSHVPVSDRLGTDSLDDLIRFRTKEREDAIAQVARELREINQRAIDVEAKASPEYRKALEAQLAAKQLEHEAHLANKPATVSKPDTDPVRQAEAERINREIEAAATIVTGLESELASAGSSQATAARRVAVATKLLGKLANLTKEVDAFKRDSTSELAELGIELDSVLTFKVDTGPIDEAKKAAGDDRTAADVLLDETADAGLPKRLEKARAVVAALRQQLDGPAREYQMYLAAVKRWEEQERAIIGDSETTGSLKALTAHIATLASVAAEVEAIHKEQLEAAQRIFAEKVKLAEVYRELYAPVQRFISEHRLARDRFKLEFEVSIAEVGFSEKFLASINQSKVGSFYGNDEGREVLKSVVSRANFGTGEGVQSFLSAIREHLSKDMRAGRGDPTFVPAMLKKHVKPLEFYDMVFGLEYVEPRFVLRWEGKDLEKLSPGERGTLLLIFYLLVDKGDRPLVIDQPEGNLDNETVARVLVDCIKDAKNHRQVFIVTHNPNLAVVCDADQVVCAKLDKVDASAITYKTGALENPEICARVIEVLEGNKDAFDLRDYKYRVGQYVASAGTTS